MNSKIKNILIFAVVAVALVLIYIFFIKKNPADTPLISSSGSTSSDVNTTEPSEVGKDFIAVLLSVKSIKLDDSIFANPAFSFLKDSSITITQDNPEGRPNPFAPIGAESIALSPEASNQTTNSSSAKKITNNSSSKPPTTPVIPDPVIPDPVVPDPVLDNTVNPDPAPDPEMIPETGSDFNLEFIDPGLDIGVGN